MTRQIRFEEHAHRALIRDWLLPSRRMKRRILPPAIGLVYIGVIALLGGLRADHVFVGLLGMLDLYNEKTRSFLRGFFPFMATGAIFDSMRYFYWEGIAGRVHIAGPYFSRSAGSASARRTWNEWFALHHWPALDLACGFAYLVYVAEYVAFAMWFFFRGQERQLARGGGVVPHRQRPGLCDLLRSFRSRRPEYVSQYGLGPARLDIHPEAAAALRFDALFGTHFFNEMYGRGVDVYGAYPSLHAAYPFIVLVVALAESADLRWARIPAAAFFALMCLSAVYLQHHYLTDAVLGVAYAAVTLWLATRGALCGRRRASRRRRGRRLHRRTRQIPPPPPGALRLRLRRAGAPPRRRRALPRRGRSS